MVSTVAGVDTAVRRAMEPILAGNATRASLSVPLMFRVPPLVYGIALDDVDVRPGSAPR